MDVPLYRRQPLRIERGVPIFIERQNDSYVENYDAISADHIASISTGAGNPFISEATWSDIERNCVAQGKRHIKPEMRVLDVGVGTGRLLSHFPEARRYGVDVSLNYAERLVSTGIEVVVGKVEDLPYVDSAFGIVFCTDVLEHVEDLLAAARELVRVVEPGGLLIARVPYKEDLAPYLQPEYPYRLAHLRSFDENSLRLLFERQLGCETVRVDFDYSKIPSLLRLPLPRGKISFTKVVAAASRRIPSLESAMPRLYRPLDVTVSFQRVT